MKFFGKNIYFSAAIFLFITSIFSLVIFEKFIKVEKKLILGTNISQVEPYDFSSSFIVIADTGKGSEAQYKVADAIEKYCQNAQDCQAVFIAGDIIYEEGIASIDDPQFQSKFEQPYKNINLPFYIAFGNHDYAGCLDCFYEYSNISSKWEMPARYYRQDFQDLISFFVIDTEDFDQKQQAWLAAELAKNQSEYEIVVGHRPIKSYEVTKVDDDWRGRKELRETICSTADAYVTGHAHLLEDVGWLKDCETRQLISGGGGAETRKIDEKHKSAFFYEDYGFLVFRLTDEGLIYSFFDTDNNQLHEEKLIWL